MVKDAVQQHAPAAFMHFLHQMDKEFVAGLQVFLAHYTLNILCRFFIIPAHPVGADRRHPP